MTTMAEARARIARDRDTRRGLAGATDDEWLVGYTGSLMTGSPIYGTFTMPEEGEPMAAAFTDGQKWTNILPVQRLMPGLYMNCIGGVTFEWPDGRVLIYSALSRQGEPWCVAVGGA